MKNLIPIKSHALFSIGFAVMFVFIILVSGCDEAPSTSQIANTSAPKKTIRPTVTLRPTSTSTPFTLPPTIFPDLPAGSATQIPISSASNMKCIPKNTLRQLAYVNTVIDGDTISVTIDHAFYKVRYIGIDTPEQGEDYAVDATYRNAQLVTDKWVTLVRDTSETDKYDRLLRYVIIGDTFVNYTLVSEGWAEAKDYPPDIACSSSFDAAERTAANNADGIWTPKINPQATKPSEYKCDASYPTVCIYSPPPYLDCEDITARNFTVYQPDPHNFDTDKDGIGCETGSGVPPSNPPIAKTPTASGGGGGNCHPSYPTVCIPYPPPDLDCGDIPYRRFKVLPPDPHGFDGDNDGVGCESG